MPIYEYACSGCGVKFEMHRSISDETLPGCPSCKGTSVKKLISQTAFQLKGGGWYKDGYGSTSSDSSTKTHTEVVSTTPASGGAGTESKPAAEKAAPSDTSPKKEAAGS